MNSGRPDRVGVPGGRSARHGRAPGRGGATPPIVASWQGQSWPMRILRAFLGLTFLYAGVQKFLDPHFLHAGSPDYIGEQLKAFADGSPIRPLLLAPGHVPVITGIGVAVTEIAAGIGTLLGIAPLLWSGLGVAI